MKAFQYGFQALDVRKKTNDYNGQGVLWALSNIGRLFQEVEDYTTAIDYYMQAYDYAEKHNIDWVYFKDKIAECYWLMNRNDSALYFAAKSLLLVYKDSIALKRRLDDPQSSDFKKEPPEPVLMAGMIHLIHHDYDKALKNYLEGIKSLDSTDIINAMRFLPFISKTYFEKGDYKNALLYSQKLLRLAENKGAMQYIRDATKQLWQIYDRIKVVDSSYKYYQQYTVMKDSVDNYRFLSQLTSFKQAAANEKKELQFQQQLEQESFTKKILVISIIVVLLISVFVLRFISLKRKNEAHQRKLLQNELEIQKLEGEKTIAELQQQKTELEKQALRAQMNPHFIFNSLNSINRFILKKQSTEATEYLTKFSRLIRMILNNSVSASISLADDLEALQLYLELERLRCEEKFSFKINCDPELDTDFIQVPPMLLQPFAENAIWHGLMSKEDEGHLRINISEEKSNLICVITDDGIGRKKAAELKDRSGKHKSMGMKITESRIAMMRKMNSDGKSIEIKDLVCPDGSAAGTEVVLRIPVVQ